jgi:hypothetical protein
MMIPLPPLADQEMLVALDQQFVRAIDSARERQKAVYTLRNQLLNSLLNAETLEGATDVQ